MGELRQCDSGGSAWNSGHAPERDVVACRFTFRFPHGEFVPNVHIPALEYLFVRVLAPCKAAGLASHRAIKWIRTADLSSAACHAHICIEFHLPVNSGKKRTLINVLTKKCFNSISNSP